MKIKDRGNLRIAIEDGLKAGKTKYCAVVINKTNNVWNVIYGDDKVATTDSNQIVINIDYTKHISYWRRNNYHKWVFALALKSSEKASAWLQMIDEEVYGIKSNVDAEHGVKITDSILKSIELKNKTELKHIISTVSLLTIYVNPSTGEWSEVKKDGFDIYTIRPKLGLSYYKANNMRVYEQSTANDRTTMLSAVIQAIEVDMLGVEFINGRKIHKKGML